MEFIRTGQAVVLVKTISEQRMFSDIAKQANRFTMAAIDPLKTEGRHPITVYFKRDDSEYPLCTLISGKIYQQPIELTFDMSEEVYISVKGPGTVYLYGYLLKSKDGCPLVDVR